MALTCQAATGICDIDQLVQNFIDAEDRPSFGQPTTLVQSDLCLRLLLDSFSVMSGAPLFLPSPINLFQKLNHETRL